jgi:hypothetical protein
VRLVPVLLLSLLASLLLVAAAPAGATADTLAAPQAKAKPCKKNKVRLTVGKKRRCVAIGAALPKPAAVDPRLAILRSALTPAIGRTPDPGDKLPPPAEAMYRKLGPGTLPAMEKAVAAATAKLDDLGAARARLGGLASASADSANSATYTFGNVTIDARLSIAADATGTAVGLVQLSRTTDQGGGRSVKVTTEIPLGAGRLGFRSSGCPTADGKVDAKDGIGIKVRTEFRSDGGKTLDQYYVVDVEDETELQGIVADDAKLDSLEIRSIEKVTEAAGGSIWGGSIVKGTIVRNTVVDMRTGKYNPSVTVIGVGATLSGALNLLAGPVAKAVAVRLKESADKGFAATVDFEIKKFRELEANWNKPNACAKLTFGRASRSLTLHRGDKGTESVRLDAAGGGTPAAVTWSSTAQANGTATLAGGSGNPTSFAYEVLNAGPGVEYQARIKAVSKAGVAEESWVQPTEERRIEVISGSFSGRFALQTALGEPSVQSWSGTLRFQRQGGSPFFALVAGSVSVSASGIESSGVTGCHQSGGGSGPIAGGSLVLTGRGPTGGAPFDYTMQAMLPFLQLTLTRTGCPPGAAMYEGTQFQTSPAYAFSPDPATSADGVVFSGSKTESFGGTTIEQAWSLTGSE